VRPPRGRVEPLSLFCLSQEHGFTLTGHAVVAYGTQRQRPPTDLLSQRRCNLFGDKPIASRIGVSVIEWIDDASPDCLA
jgi:hypothetical protein